MRSTQDFESLKRDVAEASCWLLRLAILENTTSQMFIADHLATLIGYVPLDGHSSLATKCITHMLSTNVELQETKVKDSDIKHFINMIRSSNMSAAYLDLLRSVCSCQGNGIDGNQCRVVDLWLKNSFDLNMQVVVDPANPLRPSASIKWQQSMDSVDVSKVMGGTALVDGLPCLMLKWTTEVEHLQPKRFGMVPGIDAVPIGKLFTNSFDENKQQIQKYFIAQLYLGAVGPNRPDESVNELLNRECKAARASRGPRKTKKIQ